MTGIHLIEQDSPCRPVQGKDSGHDPWREQEERARERLLATTRANWLCSGRDSDALGRRGEYAEAA